ncbi:MAG TPA: MBL fold metallo-hydrolase [Amycolatopsis sp.]|uniref:MBL fold metallo-hydrolase n=1 Tax=Amycolatopsis sp. TaxID=37632 RepID=UPI002B47F7E0|nr:MBL fold metallo-hydrolase [Amycolatopsis sp.]HKS44472.1 MBL fold metallo-hydrolase [Amycolatopsis sp.]
MGDWVELGHGVFARRYEHLDQTLGLVVGAERCLVIDTGGDEVQGAEFAAAIREVTDLPWVVAITHAHFDHYFGTAAFRPGAVWAHERCREVMAAEADNDRARWAAKFTEDGEHELADRLDAAELVLPDEVFDAKAAVDLGGREVVLLHPGLAHTDHDIAVHVPDVGVVFAGDLVESGAPPAIGTDAHPVAWPRALDKLLALHPRVVVPGHGEPVNAEFVEEQRDELHQLSALFRAVQAGRMPVEKAVWHSPYPIEVTRPVLSRAVSRT